MEKGPAFVSRKRKRQKNERQDDTIRMPRHPAREREKERKKEGRREKRGLRGNGRKKVPS